jgi:hypothetical protein
MVTFSVKSGIIFTAIAMGAAKYRPINLKWWTCRL